MPNSARRNGAPEGLRLIKEENRILQWASPYGGAADVLANNQGRKANGDKAGQSHMPKQHPTKYESL